MPFVQSETAYAAAATPKYLLEVRFPVGGVLAHLLPFFPGYGATWVDVGRVVDEFLDAYLRGDRASRRRILTSARGPISPPAVGDLKPRPVGPGWYNWAAYRAPRWCRGRAEVES